MSPLDWIIIVFTLVGIILYGLYKSRTTHNLDGYFLSNRSLPWWIVLLSIMGTQASAITFLSAPGQAYTDGMRFVQYYFGLPLAMVVICITFVPLFNKLKVYTAYQFLETRFDSKTRTFTSILFLLQRGVSTGISIYAPAIILSSLFGWDIIWTNIMMGGLLIIYTAAGGAKAVAYTQQLQLGIIFAGMFLAGYMVVKLLPGDIGFTDALHVSGEMGKLNVITTGIEDGSFNWKDRYNLFSGIIGGFFLALSYFGTDQSQVGRYLTAQNNRESRLGLLMNGIVKVPMQFLILLIGALVFAFYQFREAPIFFNDALVKQAHKTEYSPQLREVEQTYNLYSSNLAPLNVQLDKARKSDDSISGDQTRQLLKQTNNKLDSLRSSYKSILKQAVPNGDTNDTNYVFLGFVRDHLPQGLRGLLIVVIFLAAWGSIAAALNSLASSSVIDFHKRFSEKQTSEQEYRMSKWYTVGWGVFCVIVALFANRIGQSLIETVNILGSLFYGVVLGIFLVAFYLKRIGATAVFLSAIVVETYIILSASWPFLAKTFPGIFNSIPQPVNSFMDSASQIGFLWLNAIGALGVVILSCIVQLFLRKKTTSPGP